MKEKSKKIIAYSIILFMVLNYLLPLVNYAGFDINSIKDTIFTGLAEEQEEVGREYEIKETEEWDISQDGDRSVIAKWKLEDRSLTISGIGNTKNWKENSSLNWHKKYKKLIVKVIIKNGITNMGEYIFSGCSNITSITIPNSVTSIRSDAFRGCSSLTSITIPNSVTSIGEYAFYGCSSLTSITIPEGVTSIESSVFYGCNSLTSISIPKSVTNIKGEAFYGCSSLTSISIPESVTSIVNTSFNRCNSLREINVSANNSDYTSINGILFNKEKTSILRYPSNKDEKKYNIPNGVTYIGSYAFYLCNNLTNITVPESVTSIGSHAFYECSSLTTINIPEGVTTIGMDAFYWCISLTNIIIPNSVTSIDLDAFCRVKCIVCKTNSYAHKFAEEDKDFYILSDNVISNYTTEYQIKETEEWDISQDEDGSLIAKWKLEDRSLTISGTGMMKNWNDIYAKDCYKKYKELIEKVIIENGVTNIGKYAFYKCNNITNITIPNSVTSIESYAFYECNSLTSIIIPNSVKSIGKYSFDGCSSLTNITIPNGVESIEEYTFLKCSNLTSIIIPGSVKTIESDAFVQCCNLKNITISNGVESIKRGAFRECSSLTSINIPKSVTNIEESAFIGCSKLKEINVSEINEEYTSIDGVLYNKEQTQLIKYPSKKGDKEYNIPNSVKSIGWYVFEGCSNLTNINIPNNVKSIGRGAFKGCSSLTSIIIPESVTRIDYYVFQGCNSLTSISIPNSVTSIESYAFDECSSLTSVNIPDNVKSIGSRVFDECSSLTEINVSDNNTKYLTVDGVLYNKEKTQLIKYPSNKKNKEYSILNSVTSIGEYAFSKCNNLLSIVVPKNVTEIKTKALEDVDIIICIANTYFHKYTEDNELPYLLDEEGPTVELSNNGENIPCKSSSTIVQIKDLKSGLNEEALKYVWSTKDTISKDKITKNLTNGKKINTPSNANGNYYLYIYAEDFSQNETIYRSDLFKLDNTAPTINLEYSIIEKTNQNVTVRLTSNEELQVVEGWTLSKDKKVLTKTYEQNVGSEEVLVKDIAGNETKPTITITNIDKISPIITKGYSTIEKTNQNVTVTLTANEEIQSVEGWTLSKDKKVLTKQYEQNVSNEAIIVKDIAGNETKQIITVSNIDKIVPTVTVKYSTTEKTTQNVTVTLTANEELQEIEGWTISQNKKVLTKEYENSVTENLAVKDIAGNETKQTIKITNIDKKGPKVEVNYSTTEKTKENVTVTLRTDEEVQDIELEGWTLSDNKKELTKTYTENKTETISLKDELGNETKQTIKVSNIDKTAPKVTVTYSTKELTNQNVIVTLTSSEEVQAIEGWTLSEDKKILTKQYEQNVANEEIIVKDIAGNETKQIITVSNIDKIVPTVTVKYSTTEKTKENVTVTLTGNEELQGIEGWTLSKDKKILTKEYEDSVTENLAVKDIAGNETKQAIKITNIDKKGPKVEVNYSTTEKTKENVTVTLRTDEEVQDIELEGWTLSDNKKELTKTYTENKTETINLKDKLGNETKQTVEVSNIDRISPTVIVTYSSTEKPEQSVTVTLTADEEVQEIAGWTLSKDKKVLTKQYEQNVANEEIIIKDIVGNETKQTITINNIDKVAPTVAIKYSTKESTNKNVTVILTSSEEIQAIAGWILSEDKKILTKTYENNATEIVTIKDIAGNETKQTVSVTNIKKIGDINENNKIDIGDILLIKRHMAYTNSTIVANKHSNWKLSDEKTTIGDINKNGKIDIGDILKLQRYISASNSKEVAEKHKEWLNL